jgi:hypothetical protein
MSLSPGRGVAPAAPTAREEVAAAFLRLWRPLPARFSPGCARVRLGAPAAHYSEREAELESFARPLWGIAPHVAGGGEFSSWDLYLAGLDSGSNPEHPEYWGADGDHQHAFVEMPAIALALILCQQQAWDPLPAPARRRLVSWLSQINERAVHPNNWLFFRVLVNLGLRRVGAPWDREAVARACDQLGSFYRGGGWYRDGNDGRFDYYNAFALHFYGLLYAALAPEDASLGDAFRQRAAEFAGRFVAWFARDGAAVPFGRSAIYRFAQGAFWGALALADQPALPWGVIKGLYLRHLRWWLSRPILNADGTLSVGYGYANGNIGEDYNSAGSPYWAMKFFLPLALPATHPFWTAQETGIPALPPVSWDPHPQVALYGTEEREQVILLNGGQDAPRIRWGTAKYGKFAYSSHFAFNVPGDERGARGASFDNALLFCRRDDRYFGRERVLEVEAGPGWLLTRWSPLEEATVWSWLIPAPPWHVRVHQILLRAPLTIVEGGFSVPRDDAVQPALARSGAVAQGGPGGWSGLRDLLDGEGGCRLAWRVRSNANTNLLHTRTDVPVLQARFSPGILWLATGVLACVQEDSFRAAWGQAPGAQLSEAGLTVRFPERPDLLIAGRIGDQQAAQASRPIAHPRLRD